LLKVARMLRLAALFCCIALPLRAETALAAVAANFAGAAGALVQAFAADSGHEVVLTTGSTGKLFAQISNGAPFDLFLSADAETPARLQALGHGAAFPYAYGRLMLWAPASLADAAPPEVLKSTRHIAIANPALAPYGTAALETLEGLGLAQSARPQIVMGENVGQAYALVASGAAGAGFVAASALTAAAPGLVWLVTPDLYTPIRQDALVLQHGAENPAALAFAAYLQSPAARAIIQGFGYGVPE
jgi:molybdate transport system substrate-binding protein